MTTLVVARYREDISWLERCIAYWGYKGETDIVVELYNKGGETYPVPHYVLPNIGRESHTYLTFLASRPKYVGKAIFVQGRVSDHLFPKEIFDINSHVYLPNHLVHIGQVCDTYMPLGLDFTCEQSGCPNHCGLPLLESWQQIQQIAKQHGILLTDLPEQIPFTPGACFAVNLDRFSYIPNFWDDLRSWLIQDEIRGYVLERFWQTLFTQLMK